MENSDEALVDGLNSRSERNETFLEILPDEETLISMYDSEDGETPNYGSTNRENTIEDRDFQRAPASRWSSWIDLIFVVFLLFSLFHVWRRRMAISESVKVATGIPVEVF